MAVRAPHFLLTAHCSRRRRGDDWCFALQTTDGRSQLVVEDAEPDVRGERLELLTVVRGLEALEQPSKITLLTGSSYVSRGLKYGLEEWRTNDWHWESHGKMVPVKNADLWRRLDRALRFHTVECRLQRFDPAHAPHAESVLPTNVIRRPKAEITRPTAESGTRIAESEAPAKSRDSHRESRRAVLACRRWLREAVGSLRLRFAQFGTGLLPRPWFE